MGGLDGRDLHWRVKRDRSRHRGSIMKVGRGTIRATCPNSEILPECTDEVFYGLPRRSPYPHPCLGSPDKRACSDQYLSTTSMSALSSMHPPRFCGTPRFGRITGNTEVTPEMSVLPTIQTQLRQWVTRPVAVEKLTFQKPAEITSRQDAL